VTDLITHTAILGVSQVVPGPLQVKVTAPPAECVVAHEFPDTITDPRRGIAIDVTDCTVYIVNHLDRGDADLSQLGTLTEIFEQTLEAISEAIIWSKANDQAGTVSRFVRQVGRLDVKCFFVAGPNDEVYGWLNPLYQAHRNALAFRAQLFQGARFVAQPTTHPLPAVVRRLMGSVDLLNLGFHTEAFITLFALTDDLVQEVIKAGMGRKGLGAAEQKDALRAIKEERLRHFLTTLAKLCDWQSLQEAEPDLFRDLMKANSLRNKIMHGSARLTRKEATDHGQSLLTTIAWLTTNPFGYAIPPIPPLRLAQIGFSPVPLLSEEELREQGASRGDS
jgi:hypothetical protein